MASGLMMCVDMFITAFWLACAAHTDKLTGMSDAKIGAPTILSLDSPTTRWTASTDGASPPAGCGFTRVQPSPVSAVVLASGRVEGVRTREACCERCWAEALCVSSLHDAGAALCLLQTSPESGAATVLAAEVDEAWTRCEPKRTDGPPLSLQIDASVPGDLLTDLQRAGVIGDPLREKNWLNSSLWNHHTWTYTATFSTAQLGSRLGRPGSRLLLVFDGIKMGATVELDGARLGVAADQFRKGPEEGSGARPARHNTRARDP